LGTRGWGEGVKKGTFWSTSPASYPSERNRTRPSGIPSYVGTSLTFLGAIPGNPPNKALTARKLRPGDFLIKDEKQKNPAKERPPWPAGMTAIAVGSATFIESGTARRKMGDRRPGNLLKKKRRTASASKRPPSSQEVNLVPENRLGVTGVLG